MIETAKESLRLRAKQRRLGLQDTGAGIELIKHFPLTKFVGTCVGGYWPLPGEMNVRPLLRALSESQFEVSLPCIAGKAKPLAFRVWAEGDEMRLGQYNLREPLAHQAEVSPTLVLVPLLAFTPDGKRLGYGGGFYDRTLAKLRREGDVFACGVAFAGQEVPDVPTDEHDQFLDGILTEQYFKVFT